MFLFVLEGMISNYRVRLGPYNIDVIKINKLRYLSGSKVKSLLLCLGFSHSVDVVSVLLGLSDRIGRGVSFLFL